VVVRLDVEVAKWLGFPVIYSGAVAGRDVPHH